MKLESLRARLQAASLQPFVLPVPGSPGAGVLVTAHGARILGLFTQAGGENLYFTNPELDSPGQAGKWLAGEHVLGGDRVWIAPERGLFFKGNKLEDGVVTQPGIDPGNWLVAARGDSAVSFVNGFTVSYFHVPGSTVRGTVHRTIRPIESPFTYNSTAIPGLSQVRYAGYEIASRFELLKAPADTLHFGLWFLIQLVVPHSGFMYAPTTGKTTITDYYEPTGSDYLRVADDHVRFKLDSIDRHKIGLRKTEVTGRIAFLSNAPKDGSDATLVVRNFLNNPSAHYSDVPLSNPAGTQDSVQSYNHNTGPAGFGEIEYHSPGVCRAMPYPVVADTNQVWAFTGPRSALTAIAARLLNLPAGTFGP